MPTTPDQIDLLRQSKSEDQRLEFKEAQQQYDLNKLCNYCVTLANEGGGKLILGIGDKPPRRVVGTQACNDTVGMAQSCSLKLDSELTSMKWHIPKVGLSYFISLRARVEVRFILMAPI
jgi:predicted HTH transcriptional regulator